MGKNSSEVRLLNLELSFALLTAAVRQVLTESGHLKAGGDVDKAIDNIMESFLQTANDSGSEVFSLLENLEKRIQELEDEG